MIQVQRHRQKPYVIERTMAPTDFILIGGRDQTINFFFSKIFCCRQKFPRQYWILWRLWNLTEKMAKMTHFYKKSFENTSKSVSNIAKKFCDTKGHLLISFSFWFVTFVKNSHFHPWNFSRWNLAVFIPLKHEIT